MILDNQRLLYRLPLLYRLHLSIIIYFRNKEVEAGFCGKKPSTQSTIIISGTAGLLFFFFLFWILFKTSSPSKIVENKTPFPNIENRQETLTRRPTNNKKLEKDKNIQKAMGPLPVKEKVEGPSTQNMGPLTTTKEEDGVAADKEEDEVAAEHVEPLPINKETKEAAAQNMETLPFTIEGTFQYMRVNGNLVNIRESPLLESGIIARLGKGYMIKKSDSKGDWVYVDSGKGFKGWIHNDLLENATGEDYEAWENNPNRPAVIGVINKDLEDPANIDTEKLKVEKLLFLWKSAWEKKDIDKYMSLYSKAFEKSTHNWESYKNYKKHIFDRPNTISVEINNINIDWDNYFMIASFIQKYNSGPINSTIRKMITFQQEDNGWKIVKEVLIKSNTT